LTETGHMVLRFGGEVVADLPIAAVADGAPEYDRPHVKTPPRPVVDHDDVPARLDPAETLKRLMGGPNFASRRWLWERYDSLVRGHTLRGPGGDAAVVRLPGTDRGLALTSDCTPRYCVADPVAGGAQAVAEAWRNLTAVGARP